MTEALLRPELIGLMKRRGWKGLTELQERAARAILAGKNVLIMAPTGEGKTEAALLPLLTRLTNEGNVMPVSILYVTPMRALINDLHRRISYWAEPLGLRVAKKHGDVPSSERYLRLRNPPHVLLTTPESLEIDLDWAPKFREYYRNVKAVIVDEVHELLSSKRGAQLLLLLERLARLAGDFQRIGLSATIGNPGKALALLRGSSRRESELVSGGGNRGFLFEVRYIDGAKDPWPKVAEIASSESSGPTLIFTNSRYVAEKLSHELQKGKLENVYVHHSSVSAEVREMVEEKLRRGEGCLVVCTKTLELGIDVGSIRKVIQVRAPGSVAALIQRTGRSFHRLGGTSMGLIITTDPVDLAEALAETRLATSGYVEDEILDVAPADVIAKEVVGSALSKDPGLTVEELYKTLKGSPIFKLSHEEFLSLIKYMKVNGVIDVDDKGSIRVGGTFYRIWRLRNGSDRPWSPRDFSDFFSTIPKRDMFAVRSPDSVIGYIDAYFVYRNLRVGDVIRLAGSAWEVSRIDEVNERVDVIPAKGSGEIPLWKGEGLTRSKEVSEEFYRVILDDGWRGYESGRVLEAIGSWYKSRGITIGPHDIAYERVENEQVLLGPFGSKLAETLGVLLVFLAAKSKGLDAYYRPSFFGVSVNMGDRDALSALMELGPEEVREAIYEALDYLPIFHERLAEAKYDLGKLGEVNKERDSTLIDEVKKFIINKELDVEGAIKFVEGLRKRYIKVHVIKDGPSPLSQELLSLPPVRLWVQDLAKRIAELLKDWAFTSIEIAEELKLSEKTVLNKLKDMRRPEYNDLRVIAFLDVNSDEWRWTLASSFNDIASSEDFAESFTPLDLNAELKVTAKKGYTWEPRETIVKPKDVVDRWNLILPYVAGTDEIYELKVSMAGYYGADYESSVTYHYVNANHAKLLILNAAAYLQRHSSSVGKVSV
ncbi:Putative ATP-dependent helicase [Acidilobus saccharovorans 345-15]|uniref:Putative ATP-dependent helicase n=1 Tax=Acidilobus saccharovorans (strain DSM 16705 / JCM 18335 / VKM B-2471 / 345-15) TaxID=666510 RepID=D9PZV0_ACIS3|nr:DEAD/DEAH box helicase [Acidilobus saccharovorans]ADL18588.1 Putative ATP-dependent helicase [Acidilobus saccharovorans 345-15]